MADHDAGDGWDLIVTPWHLDEHIAAFPVPVGVAETIRPSLPDSPVPGPDDAAAPGGRRCGRTGRQAATAVR
jgi:hypothetical protein